MLLPLLLAAAPLDTMIEVGPRTVLVADTIKGPATRRTALLISAIDDHTAIYAEYSVNCRTGIVRVVKTAMSTGGAPVDGPPQLVGKQVNGPHTPRIRALMCAGT
jgi:hypothetical protein